jgi:hypothetical protein
MSVATFVGVGEALVPSQTTTPFDAPCAINRPSNASTCAVSQFPSAWDRQNPSPLIPLPARALRGEGHLFGEGRLPRAAARGFALPWATIRSPRWGCKISPLAPGRGSGKIVLLRLIGEGVANDSLGTTDMTINARLILAAILATGMGLLDGCSLSSSHTIFIKALPTQNPRSWVFEASVEKVSAAVSEHKHHLLYDWSAETSRDVIFDLSAKVLAEPGNKNDAYLYCPSGEYTKLSEVYFGGDRKACQYGADFHVHLTRLTATKTKVEVCALRPFVYLGEEETTASPFYMHRRGIFVKAKPTSIEEYMILQNIGRALAATNMPALVLPAKSSKLRAFHYRNADEIDFARDKDLTDWKASF